MSYLKGGFRPGLLGILASVLVFWACHVNNEEADFFNVKVDSTWTRYDRVAVVLAESDGTPLDTLFDGKLVSADQLNKLDGSGFEGGKVQLVLIGYLGGEIAVRETRPYDGNTGVSGEKIIVILIPLDPPEGPDPDDRPSEDSVLDIRPDNARIYTGGPDLAIAPSGSGWEQRPLAWFSEKPGVAAVSDGTVKAVAPGKTWIKAVSGTLRDSSEITVVTDPPVLDAGADTVVLLGATVAFRVKAEQEFGVFVLFKWSVDGDSRWDDSTADIPSDAAELATTPVTFSKAGSETLRFLARDGEGNSASATRKIIVADTALPVIASVKPGDTTVSIRDSLTFTAQVTSKTVLEEYAWDFDGDGRPDESGSLSGKSATLTGGRRFPDTGSFPISLKVTDAQGGTASRRITITVVLDAPTAEAGADTTVTAGTRVNLHGKAEDGLGRIVKTEWKIGAGAFAVAPLDTHFTAPEAGVPPLSCFLRVTDDDGQVAEDEMRVTVLPADADLASLAISAGALSPAFSKSVQAYAVNVVHGVSSITLTPTASDAGSTIKINGAAVASGAASGSLALSVGANVLTVEVTAKSGLKKTYTVTVTRAGSAVNTLLALTATAGTLSPAFNPETLAYTVNTSLSATTITPTVAASSNAAVKVDGAAVASGTASGSIALPAGSTTKVTIVVTAQNGGIRTYTIAFVAAAAGRPDLVVTAATLTSKTPARVNYTYTIENRGTAAVPDLFNVSIQNFWSADTVFNNTGDQAAGGAILGITKALAPGESHTGTFAASGAVPAGLKYLTFKIDWGDTVLESNEENNTVARQVLVPPVADAGADTTVAAGSSIRLRGKASDPLGSVAKTEWKIGSGVYAAASPETTFTAPAAGVASIPCSFRVTDDDGLVHEDAMVVTVAASADADLQSLVPSTGSLSPAFAKTTVSYTMSVANGVSSMTLTPTASHAGATLKVNGTAVAGGAASGSLALSVGANVLTVEVTAGSGLKKTYTVTVTRAGSAINTLQGLTATAGALSPAFAAGTLAYSVNSALTATTITPTVTAGSGATVKVNGVAVASGSASASISLPAGSITTVNIVVTAQNGTTRTYSIAFTVAGSTLPDLIITSATITSVAATRIEYSYTIKNNGGSTIPNLASVSIQNFYSADMVFNNAGDQAAGGSILNVTKALAPGESHSGTYAASGAPGAAMKYITWKIDWGEIVSESNETNNTVAMPLP